jgi:hypothetical protein
MELFDRIKLELEELKCKHPKLNNLLQTKSGFTIAGKIEIIDSNNYVWAIYEIEIKISKYYPLIIPSLIEVGGKIENHIDWHISHDGNCCLGTNAKIYRELGDNVTLENWFNKFAYPFLANHHYKIETGDYANGEFKHGNAGVFDDYKELFNLPDYKSVINYLKYVLGIKKLSLNQPCFCGSNKKFKRCFILNKQEHFKAVPKFVLEHDYKNLLKATNDTFLS